MTGLIRASLANPRAVTVLMLAILFVGYFSFRSIPIDILPVFNSPAVQMLTFYSGMPAEGVEKDITNRMERWTGQSAGHVAARVALNRRGQHRPQLLSPGSRSRTARSRR